jgi:DNA replication and repair protein RecF
LIQNSQFKIQNSKFEISVFLSSLRLRDFRNFTDERLDLPAAGVALIADNAQGKTNLLEAIYYLQIFKSFRGSADEQLVRFGQDVFRVEARLEGGDAPRQVAAAFDRRARRKKVEINGNEPERIGDAIGGVGAVIFSPADVAIVAGAPGERRRFLDIVLSLTRPGYLNALQRYRQVLARRNAVLRGGAPAAQVAAWNPGLAEWGGRIVTARAAWIAERAAGFAAHVGRISDGGDGAIEYESTAADLGDQPAHDSVAAAIIAELERVRDREERRGMTLVGPHRDDLRIRSLTDSDSWVDLRTYGSGGQQRTAAVALRMVEADSVREATGRDPILLLDDVFAELDVGRARRIMEWVDEGREGQVILTAPKPTDVELRGGSLAPWTVRAGRLSPL